MKKIILLSFCLCTFLLAHAQVSKTVSCTAGGLSAALTAEEKTTVTNLTVTGTLNANDFTVFGYNSMPSLSVLDLSGVSIVAYTNANGTSYPENELPASAFSSQSNLTSIQLPPTITSIGASAFNNCFALTSITIPANVTILPINVFARNTSLTSVDIQGAVTSIGTSAFNGCSLLKNINFPSSLTEISETAFYQCTSLETIDFHAMQITIIGASAFDGCTALTSANINTSTLTTIGQSAFSGCSSLTSMIIPESVTSMGTSVFGQCTALQSVNIPENRTVIEQGTFQGCSSLQSIHIPENVYAINREAFSGCKLLTSVPLPAALATIGQSAFSGCTALESIILPADLVTIERSAFKNCSALKSIVIPKNIISLNLAMFSGCTSLQSVSLPAGLQSLGARVFENCSSLQSINLPATVTGIAAGSFSGCTGMQSIIVNNPEPVDLTNIADVFKGVPVATCKLQVPETSIALYRNAAKWSDFTTIEKIVVKDAQTITFTDITKTFGEGAFDLAATTTSGLDITYTIEAGKEYVATLSGKTVTIVGAGTATITASQAGNDNYNAATDVSVTLTVNKADQTITGLSDMSKNANDADFTLSAIASSGLALTYSSSNTSVATIKQTTVEILQAGTTTITASQAGNNNYSAATDVTATLTVTPIDGLNDVHTQLPVRIQNGNIIVTATSGSTVEVFNAIGIKLQSQTANSTETTLSNLPKGQVLIVGSGNAVAKVIL